MNKIVITGATGVIGMALINKCIEHGIEVVALVNPGSARKNVIPEHELVSIVPCGVDDYQRILESGTVPDELANAIECDAFYHLAWKGTFGTARNDSVMQQENVRYTLEAVRLAKVLGCKTFIGVGSQAEYGRVEGKLTADTCCNPENEYGRAKFAAGNLSRQLCDELGMKHIWVRVLSIYGPYDGQGTMITSTIAKMLKGEKPSMTKGEQQWDYLYSEDAANALLLLGDSGKNGNVYPIGSGNVRPLRDYVIDMRNIIDSSLEIGFGDVSYADKQVMYLCADISKLTEDTGFVPKVSFTDGIKRTIEWVKSECNGRG